MSNNYRLEPNELVSLVYDLLSGGEDRRLAGEVLLRQTKDQRVRVAHVNFRQSGGKSRRLAGGGGGG